MIPPVHMARKALWVLLLGLVVLAMAWVRVWVFGYQARAQADRSLAAGRVDEAIGFYDRALHMYWPGSPDVARSIEQLTDIALQREQTGDIAGAIHAWRILRSGLYAARGLFQPYAMTIHASEDHIAALVARQTNNGATGARELELMRRNQDPRRGWSITALLGFVLWVGSALSFLWRALTADGRLLKRPAVIWALTFVAGYVLWLAGLSLA